MRYLACFEDEDYPARHEYFEVDDDGWVRRQVTVFPHGVVTSRTDYDPLAGGTLCDQHFYSGDMRGLVDITQDQFEKAWNLPDPRVNPIRRWLRRLLA